MGMCGQQYQLLHFLVRKQTHMRHMPSRAVPCHPLPNPIQHNYGYIDSRFGSFLRSHCGEDFVGMTCFILRKTLLLPLLQALTLCSYAGSLGVGTFLGGKQVYSGIINTDPMIADVLGRDFHKVPQGVNGTAAENAHSRLRNSKELVNQVPFAVESWFSIYAPSCPGKPSKGNDRGVSMSHYQIWADFVFHTRNEPYHDDSILIVFEDDAVIAVQNITASLEAELRNMDTDLIFLGWCYGRRHMPMCTHAYALKRDGAKRMVENWDVCNEAAIDGQWRLLANDKVFTWRKAHPTSYNMIKRGYEDHPDYFTRGIFVQKNGLVSFNHHGFQNNANG